MVFHGVCVCVSTLDSVANQPFENISTDQRTTLFGVELETSFSKMCSDADTRYTVSTQETPFVYWTCTGLGVYAFFSG